MKRIKFLSMILSINYFCDTFYTIYFFDDQIELINVYVEIFYLKEELSTYFSVCLNQNGTLF